MWLNFIQYKLLLHAARTEIIWQGQYLLRTPVKKLVKKFNIDLKAFLKSVEKNLFLLL